MDAFDAFAPLPPISPPTPWRPKGCDNIALVLQGGGALGAYQAGVYQALHEAGLGPDTVAGVSIGGINAAIIAGNPPERRVERLREFWEGITARPVAFHRRRRLRPQGHQHLVRLADHDARAARLLHAQRAEPWISPRGAQNRDRLL